MTQKNSPAARFDVCAVGNAIVDVLAPCTPEFLSVQGLAPGSMSLVDEVQSAALYDAMAAGVEASGGSAGNTVAGVGSFGGRAAYLGIVYLEGYLFDPAPARAAFEAAAEAAHAAGRKVAITLSDSFVVGRWRVELLAFIEASADIVLTNESELLALFETDDFESAAARLAAIVEVAAITRSADGSVIVAGDQRVVVEAAPVSKVIDTTGAGDQYAAGFLLGLARGLSLAEAGALGSLAAAEVIAHWGPRPMTSLKTLATGAGLALEA